MRKLLLTSILFWISSCVFAQITYTWIGGTPLSTSNWNTPTNWNPSRLVLLNNDILIFDASGTVMNITSVPSQSVGKILVTGNSNYSFTSAIGVTLALTSTSGNTFQIDNGSTLAIGNGNALNINLPVGGTVNIGGQLNLINGNLDVSSATLTLHTNSAPLARTNGQVSLNGSSTLQFGEASNTAGANITLPNSIFVSAPTISSLVMNRTNGATLSDQAITVDGTATFTLGDLTTNGAGRIRFGTAASNPVETSSSKIIGYAEMKTRTIGTGFTDFLGFNMTGGVDDIGFLEIVRRTGVIGRNTFNSNQSIDVSWDINSGSNPASGRNVVFSWLPEFDNVTNISNNFQTYIFNLGPGWTALGTLQPLTATTPLRQSTFVSVVKLNDTFTLTDQSQTLPVELISFSAKPTSSSIKLYWVTASELNFDHFEIEKSTDGVNFTSLSSVKGNGTSLIRHDYQLTDENPTFGRSYYRLKSVDFDGYTEYSEIVSVEYFGGKLFSIFPNPSDGQLVKASINFSPSEDSFITIFNNLGFEVARFPIISNELDLNFSTAMAHGIYYAQLSSDGQIQTQKFVVK